MTLARVARRPLLMTLASSGAIQMLSILTGVVLARALGPEQRGELGIIVLWPSVIAAVVVLGLPDAVSVLTAARVISLTAAVRVALPLIVVLASVGVAFATAVVLTLTAGAPQEVRSAAIAYVVFIPLNMITLTLVGALAGGHRFGAVNTIRVSVIGVAAVGLPILAASGGLSVGTAVGTYIAANVVALVLSVVTVRRLISASPLDGGFRPITRRLVGYGIRAHAGVVAGLIGERLDQLLISALLLPRQYGLYLAAVAMSTGTSIVSTSISTVLVPTVAAESPGKRLALVRRYLLVTAILTGAIAAGTALAAPALLTIVFGAAFADAVVPAQVLLIATVPLALSRALAGASRAAGMPWAASRAEWLGLVLAVPAYAVALPTAGLVGVALASVVGYSGSMLLQAFAARSALGARSIWDLMRPGTWERATPNGERALR